MNCWKDIRKKSSNNTLIIVTLDKIYNSKSTLFSKDTSVRPEFNPWVGNIPWRRKWLPSPVFWPGQFHGLYSQWGHKETWLSSFCFFYSTNPEAYGLNFFSPVSFSLSLWQLKGCCYEPRMTKEFVASRREEFYLGPVTRLDLSELFV